MHVGFSGGACVLRVREDGKLEQHSTRGVSRRALDWEHKCAQGGHTRQNSARGVSGGLEWGKFRGPYPVWLSRF